MKKHLSSIIFIIVCICLLPVTGQPCTTFVLDNSGQPVYGKNFDSRYEPCFVIVNKRGVAKTSMPIPQEPDAKNISWSSKFGSVTFNFLGRELPAEGINEAGLFVSAMSLYRDGEYPPPDSRTPVNAFQWVQYQLDNFSTVEEVIASDTSVRIPGRGSGSGHYLISDSKGNSAAIEFIAGAMVCHTGQTMPFKVLANSPYDQSVDFLKLFRNFGGILPIVHPVLYRLSLLRFAIAADMVQSYSPQDSGYAVDYAFHILETVTIRGSGVAMWSTVYDSYNRKIYFRSWKNDRIRWFDISTFDFSCTAPVKVLDVRADLSGDVTNSIADYTKEINLEMLKGYAPKLPDAAIDVFAAYPDATSCTEK